MQAIVLPYVGDSENWTKVIKGALSKDDPLRELYKAAMGVNFVVTGYANSEKSKSDWMNLEGALERFRQERRRTGLCHQRAAKDVLRCMRNRYMVNDTLENIILTLGAPGDDYKVMQLGLALCSDGVQDSVVDSDLCTVNDDMWMTAIELANFAYFKDRFQKTDWVGAINHTLPLIYMFMYFLGYVQVCQNRLITLYDSYKELEKSKPGRGRPPKSDDELRKELRTLRQKNARLEKKVEALSVSLDSSKEECNTLRRQVDKSVKTVLHEQKEEYEAQLADKDSIIAELQEQLLRLTSGTGETATEIGSTESLISSEPELLDLPETGIVCLGGRDNLHAKLREIHPNWIYVPVDDHIPLPDDSADLCVFLFTDYMSHKFFWRCKSQYKKASRCYMAGGNIDNLCKAMRAEYTRMRGSNTKNV